MEEDPNNDKADVGESGVGKVATVSPEAIFKGKKGSHSDCCHGDSDSKLSAKNS